MKHLVASIILLLSVISTQAQSIKSGIIGKWEVEKITYLNSQGKPDKRRPTVIPKNEQYQVIFIFKKNGTCEHQTLGEFDADIKHYDYMVDGQVLIIIDKETSSIVWRFDANLGETKKTIILTQDDDLGFETQTLIRK